MLDLTIRDIDETVIEKLRERAERNGVSLEAEARQAIVDRVAGEAPERPSDRQESAWDVIQRIKAKHGGGGDLRPLDRAEWQDRPVDFGR